ncbi:2374_t:CDS:1, partial [Gigaspora rosea]
LNSVLTGFQLHVNPIRFFEEYENDRSEGSGNCSSVGLSCESENENNDLE